MKKILLFFIFYINLCGAVGATELSYNDFLANALYNSYSIKLKKLDRDIAVKMLNQARAGYYPSLTGLGTTERYRDLTGGDSQITAVGNEILLNRSYYQDMAGLALSYNLFDFGARRKSFEVANVEKMQKELLLLKSEEDLILDVINIYSEALDLYKAIQIKTELYNLQKELIVISERLRAVGELSDIDILDKQILAAEMRIELDDLRNSYAKKVSDMGFYANKDYDYRTLNLSDSDFDIDYKFEEVDMENYLVKLSGLLSKKSYNARLADLEIKKRKREYEIQRVANYPKLRFDTRYNFYGSDANDFFNGVGDISPRGLTFRLSTTVVLFDGFKNSNLVGKKKLEIEKAKIEKDKQIAELRKEYEYLIFDYINSKTQIENIRLTLELVNKNLDSIKRLHSVGEATRAECIKKQMALLRKKQDLEQKQIKYLVTSYKLNLLKNNIGLL